MPSDDKPGRHHNKQQDNSNEADGQRHDGGGNGIGSWRWFRGGRSGGPGRLKLSIAATVAGRGWVPKSNKKYIVSCLSDQDTVPHSLLHRCGGRRAADRDSSNYGAALVAACQDGTRPCPAEADVTIGQAESVQRLAKPLHKGRVVADGCIVAGEVKGSRWNSIATKFGDGGVCCGC